MLTRHFTPDRVNEIVNHPSIYPWIKGDHVGEVDVTNRISNQDNVYLVGDHGCVSFHKQQPGIYEFHTSVLPGGRGQWMLDGAKYAFRYMFTHTEAFELLTRCPDGNIAAKAGAKAVGCTKVFRTNANWAVDNSKVCCDVYSVILQNWATQAVEMQETGALFHDKLQENYRKIGKKDDIHPEDNVHNQYVGAAVEMMLNGQALKGVLYYNRWARIAGYETISLESYDPLIINIREARLLVGDGDFEVLG